jgi:peptidyl-tRNA hydrolase, PTH1 family
MKAIVGLGNPGREYAGTRHNIGFEVIDEVARRWNVRLRPWKSAADLAVVTGRSAVLVEPQTFMNLSGDAVGRVAAFHKLEPADVLVVVDEVQLPLGRIRLRRSGSSGGHNGLKSIIQHIGTEFPRLRIGVGRGDPKWDLADHVLSRFGREEREAVAEAVNRAADAVEMFVDEGIEVAMNRFNQSPVEGGTSPVDEDSR